ncbi:MAG: hypothetical protein MUF15_21185 [Acidobacteria bacterium]|nr:hypothetical protein [Acidobacteriota bacterium]
MLEYLFYSSINRDFGLHEMALNVHPGAVDVQMKKISHYMNTAFQR